MIQLSMVSVVYFDTSLCTNAKHIKKPIFVYFQWLFFYRTKWQQNNLLIDFIRLLYSTFDTGARFDWFPANQSCRWRHQHSSWVSVAHLVVQISFLSICLLKIKCYCSMPRCLKPNGYSKWFRNEIKWTIYWLHVLHLFYLFYNFSLVARFWSSLPPIICFHSALCCQTTLYPQCFFIYFISRAEDVWRCTALFQKHLAHF